MSVNNAFALPSAGAYVVRRPLQSEGRQLNPGDLLPADAPVRKNHRRLEILYRTRFIQPANTTVATRATVPTLDLSFLTLEELQFLCKNRTLSYKGNADALRTRLATALAG